MTLLYTGAVLLILLFALIKWLCKALPQFIRTRKVLEQEIGALKSQLEQSQSDWQGAQIHITELIEQKQKLFHQKKSSEVRTGFRVKRFCWFM